MERTSKPVVGLFPGQGSQEIGMARAWLRESAEARSMLERAEELAERPLGRVIARGPMRDLSRTDILQPALCVVSAILWRQAGMAGVALSAAAGHSLGELTAFHAAGAMDFDVLIRLASARGRAMRRAAEAEPGGMAAIVGPPETLRAFEDRSTFPDGIVVANRNAPDQIVVSGPAQGLDVVHDAAVAMGLRARRLDVSGAWHSPSMAPARENFAAFVSNAAISDARVPVWSALDCAPVTHGEDIKQRLVGLIDAPVEWSRTVGAMIESVDDPIWIEIGPGKVLTGLLIAAGARDSVYRCDTPRTLARVLDALRTGSA